jgi:hypothetical protein
MKKRSGKRKTPQIDLPIEQARLKGIDPLYFFYNYSSGNPAAFTWNCGTTPFNLLQLGCTVAHAGAVKHALAQGGAGRPKISPISFPLRCLVCCTVHPEPDESLPGCAHDIAKRRVRLLSCSRSARDRRLNGCSAGGGRRAWPRVRYGAVAPAFWTAMAIGSWNWSLRSLT